MSKLVSFLNRLLVFVAGLAFTGIGVLAIALYYDVATAQQLADLAQFNRWMLIPDQDWYLAAMVGVGLLAFMLMVSVLGMNLRRHRIRRVATSSTDARGSIDIDLSSIAAAVADSFLNTPRVIRVHDVVKVDRGDRLMIITITADPHISLPQLRDQADQAERDIREAIGEQDLHIQFRFHLAPVERKSL